MASPKEMFEQILTIFKDLSALQKIVSGLVLAVVIVGLTTLTTRDNVTNYGVLFSSLSQSDAADVVAKLKEQRIPYQLAMNGSAIKVPAEKVLETRLSMAGEGLPRGGGVGFEIFDRTNLGVTDFVQKLNYQRALQGELARTIRQFQQIREARVHIAAPKESVFVEDQRPPSASISLTMQGRNRLNKTQIRAIVNLVCSAVSGLTEDNITVVDTAGHLLFRKRGDGPGMLSSTQLEYQLKLENNLRNKLESMFEEVVGVGKVIARVSADVDFSQVDSTEEMYDPEGQVVRSEQLLNEANSQEGDQASGIPGVKGDLASFAGNGADAGAAKGSGNQRNTVTRNYEVSKTVKHVKEAVGFIKKMSVAVMMDGTYKKVVDKDGKSAIKYIARSAAELKRFTQMAQNAVGLDPERGDRIEVVSMPFSLSTIPEGRSDNIEKWQQLLERLAQPVIYLVFAVCLILFVVKPFFRLLSNKQIEEQRRVMLAQVAEEDAKVQEDDLTLPSMGLTDKEKIYKLAQSDPDRAADLVRRWLREKA
jgi:flagellar M-ring protein FliF